MVKEFLQKTFNLAAPKLELVKPNEIRPSSLIVKDRAIASTGTEINSGYFSEEYLYKLQGNKLAIEFDKMRRSDPQIKMLLNAVMNPITAALFELECPTAEGDEGYEEDREITDHLNHILFHDTKKAFQKTVREILSMLVNGHAVIEKTYKTVFDHPEFGTYHGIQSLDLVSAKTIVKWNVDPDSGDLVSIEQQAQGDLQKNVTLPAEHFMLFNLDREGANYEGVSWLRACYGNFIRKNMYLKLNVIGVEKYAVPTPIIDFPSGAEKDNNFSLLMQALGLYTSGQANYILKPEGFPLTLSANKYDPSLVEASIDKEDGRMSKAFLAHFLELGMNTTGAYSVSNDQSDFFYSGLTHIADEVVDVFNGDLVPELVRLNYGPRAKYPRLVVSGISDKAGKELAEILGILIDKQVVTPDDTLEDSMRAKYGFVARSGVGVRKAAPAFGAFSENGLRARIMRKVSEE